MKEKEISIYELEKRLDKKEEKRVLEGEAKKAYLCPLCQRQTRQEVLIQSSLVGLGSDQHTKPREDGDPMRRTIFKGRFLVGCPDCKARCEGIPLLPAAAKEKS